MGDKQLLMDKEYIISEIQARLEWEVVEVSNDIESAIHELELSDNYDRFTYILNELLINPNHRSHQYVAKLLQDIQSPTSIPYIDQVLESGFDYLEYTCSESEVIAKWFSWLLASIGTNDAIYLLKKYAESEDEGIRNEMLYRLSKIKSSNNILL